ncbi:hypothetical protein DFR24_1402 [Panacagrimonas perspica]|uniref:Hydrazine synthase alpha subunit middle domain-containing protein n=1 Tax=Panacagrimonas perspica TaxID=381431 RepID=A0A4R7PCZ2_9GAMM|nr:hypothetical protein [Panacagrimonas perspica]TDU32014.1 hypothetical protein DFR24_1402 [Panacagrimonas perspica]THD04452.1 hypothetical protein B1810_05460 [Panacagrimonas perspica]
MAEGTEPYAHLDEYERERATLLHVMNADGTAIHQISFNQSHDRNPTVLRSGEIMFARWDHVGDRNHFPIFFANPDGTSIFVRYGAFSPGNSFLQPREMPDGKVMTSLMPLSGTNLGGALMSVDIQNFSENDQPAAVETTGVGQKQLSVDNVNFDDRDEPATFGRYTSPYPLYDGTNRALVSWSPSRPVNETDPLTGEVERVEGLPLYGVYMFDIGKQTLRPIAIPPEGWSYVDAVAVAPRPFPNVIPDKPLNADLAARGLGLLNIKSVYDTDDQDLMGDSVLAPGEVIPKTAAPAGHHHATVPDLAKLKDPAQTTAAQRPGRFLRVTKAVPTPPGLSRESIGETEMEMQQIVGYTEVEPDGSARLLVPSDTPLTLAVVDSNGMAFQTHTNWLQVRPGETRTCDGCHSPRRGVALNVTPIAGNHPNTQTVLAPQPGESMAETRTRLNPLQMNLKPDMTYIDVWTDPVAAGRPADAPLALTYLGLTTATPVNGVINFPDHIAPLFTNPARLLNTCTNCHNNANADDPVSAGLDLRSVVSGTGRLTSYESLTLGKVQFDPDTGLPIVREDDGEIEVVRDDPIVKTGGSRDSSRSSPLFEKLLERELTASAPLPARTVNHAGMMNPGELRLLAEWADVGAQYYNDPFNGLPRTLANTRGVKGLDETIFEEDVHPILLERCSMCHQPVGNGGGDPGSFERNQFVLTGDTEGDYNVTLTMVNNVCNPPANPLLMRPTSNDLGAHPHPQIGTPPRPVMSPLEADYTTIRDWIASGDCL